MAEKSFGLKQINMIGVGTPAIESSDDLIIKTNGSERLRIESGGFIGIGTDIARTELDVRGDIWINRSSANGQPAHFSNPTQLIVQHTSAPNVYLIRGEYRTSINSGDYLGQINFASNNNSSGQGTPVVAASIACDAQQNWTSSFNPGELIFRTNSGSSTSPSDAVGITSEGNIKLYRAWSGAGIDFSATADTAATGASATSELFDDYEEGTWTPTYNSGGSDHGGTWTDNSSNGTYTKIGNTVVLRIFINSSTDFSFSAINKYIRFDNLPFAPNATFAGSAANGAIAAQGASSIVLVTTQSICYFYSFNTTANISGRNFAGTVVYQTDD